MKYLYAILMTGLFLIGYLLIDPSQSIGRIVYASLIISFLSFEIYKNYEQKRQQ